MQSFGIFLDKVNQSKVFVGDRAKARASRRVFLTLQVFRCFSTSVGVHGQVGVIQSREETPADSLIRPAKWFVCDLSRNRRSKVKLSQDSSIRVAACAVKVNMPQSKSRNQGVFFIRSPWLKTSHLANLFLPYPLRHSNYLLEYGIELLRKRDNLVQEFFGLFHRRQ